MPGVMPGFSIFKAFVNHPLSNRYLNPYLYIISYFKPNCLTFFHSFRFNQKNDKGFSALVSDSSIADKLNAF